VLECVDIVAVLITVNEQSKSNQDCCFQFFFAFRASICSGKYWVTPCIDITMLFAKDMLCYCSDL